MYAPNSGATRLEGGNVSWKLTTRYPFREQLTLEVKTAKPFKARFRVPAWARGASIAKNGKVVSSAKVGANWIVIDRLVAGTYELKFKAVCEYRSWPRNGAITVDRGPLSYSLAIGESSREVPRPVSFAKTGSASWPESSEAIKKSEKLVEYLPTTPWNYGLDISAPIEYRECKWSDDCFVSTNAPAEIFVKGRKISAWTFQDHQPAPLQESPAYTTEPLEKLRFIPLGCARLRLSMLPEVTDRPTGVKWKTNPESIPREKRAKTIDF